MFGAFTDAARTIGEYACILSTYQLLLSGETIIFLSDWRFLLTLYMTASLERLFPRGIWFATNIAGGHMLSVKLAQCGVQRMYSLSTAC